MRGKKLIGLVFVIAISSYGCSIIKHDNVDTVQSDNLQEVSQEPSVTGSGGTKIFSSENLEKDIISVQLNIEDKVHSIYHGKSGDEDIILSVWPDRERRIAFVSMSGSYHSEQMSFQCNIENDKIQYESEDVYLLLYQQVNQTLKGYFYEKDDKLNECELKFVYQNSITEDQDHLYTIGSNEEVEKFAGKIIDAVNSDDIETIANNLQYPFSIVIGDKRITVISKDEFMKWDEATIFTQEFKNTMKNTCPEFLFSTLDDGVMLGEGINNIWINKNDKGKLVIIAINN